MTIKRLGLYTFICFMIFLNNGCGSNDVGGSGQLGGAAETGLNVTIESIIPEETPNVDIVMDTDCNDDGILDDPETFTDHNAILQIKVASNPNVDFSIRGKFITITSYRVEYSLSPGYSYQTTPPSIEPKEYSMTMKISSGSTGTKTIRFFDLQTKGSFLTDYVSSGWTGWELPSYSATYTFYGTDDRNRDVSLRGFLTFAVGGYNNC